MSAHDLRPQRQAVYCSDDIGHAGPFMWTRSPTPGQWSLYVHIAQVVPELDRGRGHVYGSLSGRAADDGFGNLVLIGSLS